MDDVSHVRAMLEEVAEPDRAAGMSAYMRDIAAFLGVRATARRAATRGWIRAVQPGPGGRDVLELAARLQSEEEREFAYVAIDLVDRHHRGLADSALPALRSLALTRPWWDTVDAWSGVVGRTARARPGWDEQIASWASDADMWARRIALIFQIGRRQDVDLDLMFAACAQNLSDEEFFIRKAIGWALRDAARTHPEQVQRFLVQHGSQMSGLSLREARKHLPPPGQS